MKVWKMLLVQSDCSRFLGLLPSLLLLKCQFSPVVWQYGAENEVRLSTLVPILLSKVSYGPKLEIAYSVDVIFKQTKWLYRIKLTTPTKINSPSVKKIKHLFFICVILVKS